MLLAIACLIYPSFAQAGAQVYQELSASMRSSLQKAVSDRAVTQTAFTDNTEAWLWLTEMSKRLAKRFPNDRERLDLLKTVHYEAKRAGLDPQLVLGIIEVESAFRKYAVSSAGAQGFMQVMPFWTKVIGVREHNLFHLRTNLRYGCTILRHYLDIEKGNIFRALGRYNGSLGKPDYPNLVLAAWRNKWDFPQKTAAVTDVAPTIVKTFSAAAR
jgi:soluble lytic murein transglycosylase-like protein